MGLCFLICFPCDWLVFDWALFSDFKLGWCQLSPINSMLHQKSVVSLVKVQSTLKNKATHIMMQFLSKLEQQKDMMLLKSLFP